MTTPREQLARTIFCHCPNDPQQAEYNAKQWDQRYPHEPLFTHAYAAKVLSLADAIIQAGWTPPPTPQPATYLDN